MQSEGLSRLGKRVRFFLKVFVVLASSFLVLAALAILYMVRCEGEWKGQTIEDLGKIDLSELKGDLKSDVAYMQGLGPRNSSNPRAYEQLRTCEEWVARRWESQGYSVRRQVFSVRGQRYSNLEIEIRGAVASSEIVIVSAQYDTLPRSPGANNNASGMAVLLQLSELLAKFVPERTLRLVAFVNEEPPFFGTEGMGSYVYAKRVREQNENIKVMLSLDAIGIYKDARGTQTWPFPFSLFYPDRGNFLGFIADLPSRKWVRKATTGFKRGSSFPVQAGVGPESVKGVTWSDHSSFWRFGYPAIQVTDTGAFRSPFHETEFDTMEKIDFDCLARVTVGMYGSILELTQKDDHVSTDNVPATWLMFNAVIVILAGLLSGFPFWLAIIKKRAEEAVRAWRVAHSFLVMDGMMMLIASLAIPYLVVGEGSVRILVYSLVAAGYSFVLAFVTGAWKGVRGLTPRPWGLNALLFLCHLTGALGSLIGLSIVIHGLFEAL